MTVYTCERCHYTTTKKSNIVHHLQKKKPCPSTFSELDASSLLQHLTSAPKAYRCEHCDKSFGYPSNLQRHINTTHVSLQSNTTHTIHSNNTTTSTTHNDNNSLNMRDAHHSVINNHSPTTININVYGKEDLDHVLSDPEFLHKCFKSLKLKGVPDLIEKIHLNDLVPQNHNVKFKREHYPAKMYVLQEKEDGQKPEWVVRCANEVLDELILKGRDIIVKHNQHHLVLSANPSSDESAYVDQKQQQACDIGNKKRGVYAPIKNDLHNRFKSASGNHSSHNL